MAVDKPLSLLGLAFKAKKIVLGSDYTLDAIKENKVKLIFLDKCTSTNIEKELNKKCDLLNIPLIRKYDYIELSNAIGKRNIKVIGVIDDNFASLIKKSL